MIFIKLKGGLKKKMVKTQNTTDKPKYELIEKAPEISGLNGVALLVSHQRVTQSNGSSSDHIVIKKVKRNEDGSQQGYGANVFIPVALAPQLATALTEFSDKLTSV